MAILESLEKENISINDLIENKKQNYIIENDCIVPDVKPDVIEIISTSGIININKKELLDGKIRVDGNIISFIDYKGKDESGTVIRSINQTIDFSQIIKVDNANSDMNWECNVNLNNIQARIINERKINIKADLDISINVVDIKNFEYICNVKDINVQKRERTITTNSIFGIGKTKTSISEMQDPIVGDNIAEILKVNTSFKNVESKISMNKVLVKADLLVKSMYITEDNRINVIKSVYPVMGFIDMDGIGDNNVVIPYLYITNSVFNLNNNKISLDIEISVELSAFINKNIKIIEDMYDIEKDIKVSRKKIKTTKSVNIVYGKTNWNNSKRISIEDGNILDVDSNLLNQKVTTMNDKIKVNADLETRMIVAKKGITNIKNTESLEFYIDYKGINQDSLVNLKCNVSNENYNVLPGGNVELRMDIEYVLEIRNLQSIELINNIEVENIEDNDKESNERNSNNKYNMIIYFTSSSDSLWEISKKFKTTEKRIIEDNELKNNEIQPGMQLFIMR